MATKSATKLIATVKSNCTHETYIELMIKIGDLLEQNSRAKVTGEVATAALRNIGKPAGSEIPVGARSQPLTLDWSPDPTDPKHRKAF